MDVTYALQRSFLPEGPFRHSGLNVALQLEHIVMPAGGIPRVPLDAEFSRAVEGLVRLGTLPPDDDSIGAGDSVARSMFTSPYRPYGDGERRWRRGGGTLESSGKEGR